MQYVILDLEWNNAYNKIKSSFLNEIIEIGAVKVDENLNKIDTFQLFVKVQLSKKLSSRVKSLTHIQNEDVNTGLEFNDAVKEFSKWIGDDDTAVLTWGETDLLVLIDNFKFFSKTTTIPFIKKYANLQLYVQQALGIGCSKQLGLATAINTLNVDTRGIEPHRALSDCILSLECMRKVFKENPFSSYIRECDQEFYNILTFKNYYISDINSSLINKSDFICTYRCCEKKLKRLSKWEYKNQAFRAIHTCSVCKKSYRFSVRFKKCYDKVITKQSILCLQPVDENQTKNA